MNAGIAKTAPWSRRDFLGAAGGLIVAFGLPGPGWAAARPARAPGISPDPQQLDSWLAVRPDGTVEASVGKIEAGMGVSTAFAQVVADELDVPIERVALRMGDTATTVDQRGTGSSNGVVEGGRALRQAGAEARRLLVELAAVKLGAAVAELEVRDGVVQVKTDPSRNVSYGALLGGKRFEVAVTGRAQPKPAAAYRYVGKSVPRLDLPPKVTGAYAYLADFKLPGMLHGRVLRPPTTGATCREVEAAPSLPGLVKIIHRGAFVAVVCEREEQAVRAAQELVVRWSAGEARFASSYEALYRDLRTAVPTASETAGSVGDVTAALAQASRTLEAIYEYPFQSHACLGPGCGVADVRPDSATVWMAGQKPYPLRRAVATLLALPLEKVRVIWLPGPGSYGMNDADDAAIDAVLLSQAVGRPVRVQYARADGTAWDPKGPPVTVRLRGGLDATGAVTAFSYEAFGYSGRIRPASTQEPGDALSLQLAGGYATQSTDRFQFSDESYRFAHRRKVSHLIPWAQSLGTGLRTAHLRDPDGMATCFASEGFIDELAAAAGVDPVAFRLQYLQDPRDRAVVQAAAARAGWQARGAPRQPDAAGWCRGRGLAYAPRNGTTVAVIAEVAAHPARGLLRVTRFVVAHDCGFVVNPQALRGTIEANLMHGLSRALHEEVRFAPDRVTSVDWATYPVLDMTEVPEAIDIVLLNNRPAAPSTGAGEPATRPVAAAVANAYFDATGVRVRRVPFTPANLLAAG